MMPTRVVERYLEPHEAKAFIADGPRGPDLYPDGPAELAAGGRALTAIACRCGGRDWYPLAAARDSLVVESMTMVLECATCEALVLRTMPLDSDK